MIKIIPCGQCGADTLKCYLVDEKYLCIKCAENHLKEIEEILYTIEEYRCDLAILKLEMCSHENLIDTGYGKGFSPTGFMSIYRCKDCGKEITKHFSSEK